MDSSKPFAQACEENKRPIYEVLREVLVERRDVLEIGSGTGQHAVFFGRMLSHVVWQTSDLPEHLPGIRAWLEEAGLPNVRAPLPLDVNRAPWPVERAEAAFSANTLHIMSWSSVERMFEGLGKVLEPGGVLCLYGPFNYGGRYTSESNARFDAWLKMRDPESGIRDVEALEVLARHADMKIERDYEMPANNRTLVWRRSA
ncbi:MAG: DUF938 domain-containing protein [Gammaproteobacteria bacterium]|nr:DUF938 domain-containing protein [Gammaproteobacteria bacterium]